MRCSVVLQPMDGEEKMQGWFYAHIPCLDLTTHGIGAEGAMEAARVLARLWVAGEMPLEAGESVSQGRAERLLRLVF